MPFHVDAVVVLPEHLHAIWTLPAGDSDFSERWRRIKGRFSRSLAVDEKRSASKRAKGEKGVWQRRFWEQVIRGEDDLARCKRYCWFDPVKHGFVEHPTDWKYSSLHRDTRKGQVDPDWIAGDEPGLFGERIELPVGWVATRRQAVVG